MDNEVNDRFQIVTICGGDEVQEISRSSDEKDKENTHILGKMTSTIKIRTPQGRVQS